MVGIAARQWALCPVFRNRFRNLWKRAAFAVTSNSFVVGRLMLASSWNPEWGKRLRAERERLGLSLRDVETLSHGIADKIAEFRLQHSPHLPRRHRKRKVAAHSSQALHAECHLRARLRSTGELCGVPASEALKEHKKLVLPRTYLIGPAPEKQNRRPCPQLSYGKNCVRNGQTWCRR